MIRKMVSLIHIKVLQILKIDTQWVHVSTAVNKSEWMFVDGSRIRQPDLVASWLLHFSIESFHLSGHTFRFPLQEDELSSVITQTVPLECTH